jgi:ABC-type uncharacterized transport system involved in gliding motility auxiliary subunit
MSGQQQFAQPLPFTWNPVLRPYGVEIGADMVFDRASNRPVPMPSQFGQMLIPYPFFVLAPSTKASVVNQGLEGAFLPWTSTVDTTGARAGTVTPLFVTSRAAGIEGLRVPINPMRDWPQDSLRTRLLAVQVNPLADGVTADSALPRGRLIVVGNTDFATDRFMLPENTVFLLNAIDWLGQDTDLITIRSKDRTPPKLVFESAATQDAVKYANLIGVPVLLVVLASVRLLRRRRKQKEPYRRTAIEPVEVSAV